MTEPTARSNWWDAHHIEIDAEGHLHEVDGQIDVYGRAEFFSKCNRDDVVARFNQSDIEILRNRLTPIADKNGATYVSRTSFTVLETLGVLARWRPIIERIADREEQEAFCALVLKGRMYDYFESVSQLNEREQKYFFQILREINYAVALLQLDTVPEHYVRMLLTAVKGMEEEDFREILSIITRFKTLFDEDVIELLLLVPPCYRGERERIAHYASAIVEHAVAYISATDLRRSVIDFVINTPQSDCDEILAAIKDVKCSPKDLIKCVRYLLSQPAGTRIAIMNDLKLLEGQRAYSVEIMELLQSIPEEDRKEVVLALAPVWEGLIPSDRKSFVSYVTGLPKGSREELMADAQFLCERSDFLKSNLSEGISIINEMLGVPKEVRKEAVATIRELRSRYPSINRLGTFQFLVTLPSGTMADYVANALPFLENVRSRHEMVLDMVERIPADAREELLAASQKCLSIKDGYLRVKILEYALESVPGKRGEVIQSVVDFLQGVTRYGWYAIDAVKEIPKEDREEMREACGFLSVMKNGLHRQVALYHLMTLERGTRVRVAKESGRLFAQLDAGDPFNTMVVKMVGEVSEEDRERVVTEVIGYLPLQTNCRKLFWFFSLEKFLEYGPLIKRHDTGGWLTLLRDVVRERPDAREAIYNHLMASLTAPLNPHEMSSRFYRDLMREKLEALTDNLEDIKMLLGIGEDDPLIQKMFELLTVVTESDDVKHPVTVYKKLKETFNRDVTVELPFVNGMRLNLRGVQKEFKASLESRVTSEELVRWMGEDCANFEQELDRLRSRLEERGAPRELLAELATHETHAMPYLKGILHVEPSDFDAPTTALQFATLIKNLRLWEDRLSPGAFLTDREERIFLLLRAAQFCRTGSMDNINLLYSNLMENREAEHLTLYAQREGRDAAIIDLGWQLYGNWVHKRLSEDNAFLKEITGSTDEIHQATHQADYSRTLLSKPLGNTLWPHLPFDPHTFTLSDQLVRTEPEAAVALFMKHHPIDTFVQEFKEAIDRSPPTSKQNYFRQMNTFLTSRRLMTEDQIWAFNEDETDYVLTPAGAKTFLAAIGVIELEH